MGAVPEVELKLHREPKALDNPENRGDADMRVIFDGLVHFWRIKPDILFAEIKINGN